MVWAAGQVASTQEANRQEGDLGNGRSASAEIDFAVAAIPLATLAAGLARHPSRGTKGMRSNLASPKGMLSGQRFSQKVKNLWRTEVELLSLEVRGFLQTIFERIVPTSTFIERRFAHFTHWSGNRGNTPKFSTLAAKHVTHFCKGAAQAWKEKHPAYKKTSHKTRPSWIQKSSRTTGYNIFLQEYRKNFNVQDVLGAEGRKNFVETASRAWRRLSDGEKASYSLKARATNRLRSRSGEVEEEEEHPHANEVGGLWGSCRLQDKWPISADVLAASMGEGQSALNQIASAWEKVARLHC